MVGINKPAGKGNLYELRTYRLKPGAIGPWLANFQGALPVREKHSKIIALWSGEAGQPNEVLHLWAYQTSKTRMKVRDAVGRRQGLAGGRMPRKAARCSKPGDTVDHSARAFTAAVNHPIRATPTIYDGVWQMSAT